MFVAAFVARSRSGRSLRSCAALASLLIALAPATRGQVVTRVSVDSSGVEGNGASDMPAISSDGRVVVFLSTATNLTSDAARIFEPQVFLHDRVTGATECVSVSTSGDVANR